MRYTVFDIETDNLLNKVTKIHVLSYMIFEDLTLIEKGSLEKREEIISFLDNQDILVGHNIVRYDLPVLEKLYCYAYKGLVFDTLGLSWALYHDKDYNKKHSLDHWGKRLDISKIKIDDWENMSSDSYKKRCETDVMINSKLFQLQFKLLIQIYEDKDKIFDFINYIYFKLSCLKEQEKNGIRLDKVKVEKHLQELEFEFELQTLKLQEKMPKKLGKIIRTKPSIIYKKNGEMTNSAKVWETMLKNLDLPLDTREIRELPNPNSVNQIKEWLFLLGWDPCTYDINKNGEKIPKISLSFGKGLTKSVIKLIDKNPSLNNLKTIYKVRHRISIMKSFLKNQEDSRGFPAVVSTSHGFTKTLRLKHASPVQNLPNNKSYFGKEIREVLTVYDDSYEMCGFDVKGLEDNTKQHFIYFHDPDYVNQMRVPGFDPHIDIALLANLITEKEAKMFIDNKGSKSELKAIESKRSEAKTVNFSATYKVGVKKLSRTLNCSIEKAQIILNTFWERNKAILEIENTTKIKTINNKDWLENPLNGFYYRLENRKDIFSALNQSSGVIFFDQLYKEALFLLKDLGVKFVLQYHDEIVLIYKKNLREKVKFLLQTAVKNTNSHLNLNIYIDIDLKFGINYAEVH